MRSFCGQASRIIDLALNKIIIVMFAILLLDVWFAVLDRYVFKWQIIWTEEAARYLMVWTMLLAVATAMYRRQHVFISFIYEKVPPRQRLILAAFIDLISIAVFLAIAILSISFSFKALGTQTSIFGMPLTIPHAAVGVSFFLTAVQLVLMFIRDFGKLPVPELEVDVSNKTNQETDQ
ncbi:TRAP-type C4-dicarboxylate transport system, small permease component [Pseudovibrio denitrificans]|uniref:TRAP transporter small permease protein n=1 Tax=Pseudovibrio denitrificans TaxID=258256 RepID=A0A1I7DYJ4_9HYPH|nr:TRAP transporter small permease [Pseudovibrio denitrificans]SFU16752.1 TRAP-type C4-dicarboxylate transport system, small permease component [Pseudovibrio denitrificans]